MEHREQGLVADVAPYVEKMLASPRRVLVFEPEKEDFAHEIMESIVAHLAKDIAVSDPTLENLVVLDSETLIWEEEVPGIQVADLGDVASGRIHLARSMCIAVFGNKFLRHRTLVPFVRSTRFYAAVCSSSSQTKSQVERVHPLREAVFLK